jgi:uncharacterized lipoprotein YmbA
MHPSLKLFMTCLCVVMLAGCGVTQPSKFYLLTSVEGSDTAAMTTPGPALGLGPVSFPPYLDRPEIVHRSGNNELHFAGSHRWAEPLKTSFTRSLAENLSILLPTNRVTLYPWQRSTMYDYQIILDVTRFDADASGTAILSANWEIVQADGKTVSNRQKATYSEPAGSMDYSAIVAAQSRAVGRLSRDIVVAIERSGKLSVQ